MQNKILIKLLKSFALFLVIFAPCFSFAQDAEISTSQIAKDIEKSMIFDQDARQKIDFYRSDNSKKKSSFTIKSKDFDKEDKMNNAEVKVIVTIEFRRRRPAMLLLRVGPALFTYYINGLGN